MAEILLTSKQVLRLRETETSLQQNWPNPQKTLPEVGEVCLLSTGAKLYRLNYPVGPTHAYWKISGYASDGHDIKQYQNL